MSSKIEQLIDEIEEYIDGCKFQALSGGSKIIVEKVNMVSKHVKPRRMGEQGGIIKAEGAFYACKAQVYCSSCKKATRVAHKIDKDGNKIRVCAKCGEKL